MAWDCYICFTHQTRYPLLLSFWHKVLSGKPKSAAGYDPVDAKRLQAYGKTRRHGPKPFFCYVPFTSLAFSFSGQVFACSYNRRVLLGRYPQQSVTEIWNGAEAKKLRDHMRHNDLSYGCGHCRYFVEKGKFSSLKPLEFDKYAESYRDDFPLVMEFELANTCNLECRMCSGEVSSSIRKNRDKQPPLPNPYDDAFFAQLREFIPHLREAKFYGGEPFLIPVYYKIWDTVHECNPDLDMFVITNGSVWNERVEQVLERGRFDVAVSIDALDKTKLEKIRKNIVYEELLENIGKFNAYCRKNEKYLSLSFTVQKENWDELPAMIDYCNRLQAFIFVSYLETPVRYSVNDMSLEELEHARRSLDGFAFTGETPYETHNKRCFADFLNYLDTQIADARSKTYSEYRYGYLNQELDAARAREKWKNGLVTYFAKNADQTGSEPERLLARIERLQLGLSAAEKDRHDLLLANENPEIWIPYVQRNSDELLLRRINELLLETDNNRT